MSAEKGSSMNSTSGSTTRGRAKPTRCFIPPDSSFGYALSNPSRPTLSSTCKARWCRSVVAIASASSAASTFSKTVNQAKSAKLWNTMATFGNSTVQRFPVPQDLARGRSREARKDSKQGGFARTRRPQQCNNRFWINGKIGGRNDLNLATLGLNKALLDSPSFNNRLCQTVPSLRDSAAWTDSSRPAHLSGFYQNGLRKSEEQRTISTDSAVVFIQRKATALRAASVLKDEAIENKNR